MSDALLWMGFALFSAGCTALMVIFAKLGVQHLDSITASTLLSLFTFLALAVAFLYSQRDGSFLKSLDSKSVSYIFLAALAGACSWIAYFLALQIGPVSKVSVLDRTSIIFIIFLATLIGEQVTVSMVIGACLLVIGSALIVW